MNLALTDLSDLVTAALPQDVLRTEQVHDELIVHARANAIAAVLGFLRDNSNSLCKVLVDICGVDWPARVPRFDVVYNLLSVSQNHRVRVKIAVEEGAPVPSVTGVFSAAGWYEREAWDLYGIPFSDHPDLRRLLTDYGFEGHPLRKDFPLTGRVEVRWDEVAKRVVYDPVKLTQDFRTFDFLSPWEGVPCLLPGDEKAESAKGGSDK